MTEEQIDLEDWLRDNPVAARGTKLVQLQAGQVIDPSQMVDDDAAIDMSDFVPDPTKVVHDVSADPRVFTATAAPTAAEAKGAPQPDTGPQVLAVTGPLIPLQPKGSGVQQLRKAAPPPSAQDLELAAFVTDLGMNPIDLGLVAAPEPAPTPAAALPARVAQAAPAPVGDLLERAKQRAMAVFSNLPDGVEVFVGTGLGQDGIEFVMGMGVLVGMGAVVYRGDGHYRLAAKKG